MALQAQLPAPVRCGRCNGETRPVRVSTRFEAVPVFVDACTGCAYAPLPPWRRLSDDVWAKLLAANDARESYRDDPVPPRSVAAAATRLSLPTCQRGHLRAEFGQWRHWPDGSSSWRCLRCDADAHVRYAAKLRDARAANRAAKPSAPRVVCAAGHLLSEFGVRARGGNGHAFVRCTLCAKSARIAREQSRKGSAS